MKLADKATVEQLLSDAMAPYGFASSESKADEVMACCAGVAAMYDGVGAVPIGTIIAIAMQLIPILFGDGEFTLDKLMSVLKVIQGIFA